MTNTKLIFLSSLDESTELECFVNTINEVTLQITDKDACNPFNTQLVSLDVPTAIKLSKVLRNEINKIKEVSND
jgi:hypothetical protein